MRRRILSEFGNCRETSKYPFDYSQAKSLLTIKAIENNRAKRHSNYSFQEPMTFRANSSIGASNGGQTIVTGSL